MIYRKNNSLVAPVATVAFRVAIENATAGMSGRVAVATGGMHFYYYVEMQPMQPPP